MLGARERRRPQFFNKNRVLLVEIKEKTEAIKQLETIFSVTINNQSDLDRLANGTGVPADLLTADPYRLKRAVDFVASLDL